MFACCGRGENHYRGRAGLEATCFAKLFPNTPLAGLFGNGEIGVGSVYSIKCNMFRTEAATYLAFERSRVNLN